MNCKTLTPGSNPGVTSRRNPVTTMVAGFFYVPQMKFSLMFSLFAV